MNIRYCAHCGFVNEYAAVKPKTCSKCKKDMDAAFAVIPVTTPLPRPVSVTPVEEDSFDESELEGGHEIEEASQKDEIYRRGMRMAQQLDASVFIFDPDELSSNKTFRFSDIAKESVTNAPAPHPAPIRKRGGRRSAISST